MSDIQDNEEAKLEQTKEKFWQILKNEQPDSLEYKAIFFYLTQLQKVHTVKNEYKFKKPEMGIGGTGDEEIRAGYVVRDHKTDEPVLKDGKLVVIDCVFSSFDVYMDIISSQKADSLRLTAGRGAYPVHEEDKKYVKENPYAWAFKAMLESYED